MSTESRAVSVAAGGASTELDFEVVSETGESSAFSARCDVTVRTAPGDRDALDRFVDRGGCEGAFLASP
jgi:hypothetical protein